MYIFLQFLENFELSVNFFYFSKLFLFILITFELTLSIWVVRLKTSVDPTRDP